MLLQTEKKLDQPPADATGVQLVYSWTRSRITNAEIRDGRDVSFILNEFERGPSDVVFQLPPDAYWLDRELLARVSVEGEPPHLLGVIWLTPDAKKVDTEDEMRQWLMRRWVQSMTPAQQFFLLLDATTNERLIPLWMPYEGIEDWTKLLKNTGSRLYNRCRERCKSSRIVLGVEDNLASVADHLQRLILLCFGNDMSAAESAFEEFAAGWLRQEIKLKDDRLDVEIASDADSSYVFLFAEVIFGLADLKRADEWEKRKDFWLPLANVFVRMQEIYTLRWRQPCVTDPRCFVCFRGPVPPLQTGIDDIRCTYSKWGDDLCKLSAQAKRNLQDATPTKNRRRCFPVSSSGDPCKET